MPNLISTDSAENAMMNLINEVYSLRNQIDHLCKRYELVRATLRVKDKKERQYREFLASCNMLDYFDVHISKI